MKMQATAETTSTSSSPNEQPVSIISLLPAATDICVALQLPLAGITHECNVGHGDDDDDDDNDIAVVTYSALDTDNCSQGAIDAAVRATAAKSCHLSDPVLPTPPSLYPLRSDSMQQLIDRAQRNRQNTVILTQDLCDVCGPTSRSLLESNIQEQPEVQIVSLTPHSLTDVGDSFLQVGMACHAGEQGAVLQSTFMHQLDELQRTIDEFQKDAVPRRKVLLLEWLDPPFVGGHWIVDMIKVIGAVPALWHEDNNAPAKSSAIDWKTAQACHPDVLVVACCGFGLERNVRDVHGFWQQLVNVTGRHGMIFALDGNQYTARPGPKLAIGAALLALCVYHDVTELVEGIRTLPWVQCVDLENAYQIVDLSILSQARDKQVRPECDIEDFYSLHQQACARGDHFYTDPASGYQVFTELAHQQRGRCCGSGCRHCPYSHENVQAGNKTARIQQPAVLYTPTESSDGAFCFALHHGNVRVLFFSSGKDSFLTIRALARQAAKEPFGLVLMTSFDATSRIIAHQDVSIDTAVQQAQHLGISMVGVPMHRGSRETYASRVAKGIAVVEKLSGCPTQALVFGDLHLEHIIQWREEHLGAMGYELYYPLRNVDYDVLSADLEASEVPCVVTASSVPSVALGAAYDSDLRQKLKAVPDVDLFGENGEFHTCAQVWKISRTKALGM